MKTQFILILLLTALVNCYSQDPNVDVNKALTNTYVVEYDFKTGLYKTNLLQVRVNTPVVFKIVNINRLAYDISIKSNDTTLAETYMVDEIDKSIKDATAKKNTDLISANNTVVTVPKLDISSIAKDDFIAFSAKATERGAFEVELQNSVKINQLLIQKEEFRNEISLLKEQQYLTNIQGETSSNPPDFIQPNVQNNKPRDFPREIKTKEDSIANLEIQISNLLKQQQEDLMKKFDQDNIAFQDAFNNLNQVYNSILNLQQCYKDIKTVADYPNMNLSIYQNEFKTICVEKAKTVLSKKESLIRFRENYNQVGIKYSNLKYNPYLSKYLNYGGLTKLYAQADFIKQLADQMSNDVKELNIPIVFEKLEHLLKFLEDTQVYEYVSAPIQPTQDAAVFEVKIHKRLDNSAVLSNDRSFKHSQFTFGGTRVDFSLGLAASYFPNAKIYEFGIRNDSTTLSVKSNKLIAPAVVGLITMSYRRTQYVAYGGSAGLGIDVLNGKVQLSNFFVGPTVLFGKYDRLFLSGGLSLRNVQQLKSGYNEGDSIINGANEISNYLTDKYAIGTFLSLTYNLTKGVRTNLKKLK